MNPDEYDFFRHLPKERTTVAVDLIRGIGNRCIGQTDDNHKLKESLEIYAEDKLVRKQHEEMRCEMPGQPRSTFLMVFSPDGSKVASTHGNHNIYVTDLKSGKNIRTLIGHPRTPWCIAFHPTSNQIVASGCLGGEVRIWDLSGGSEVWTTGNQSVIASIAFHPNDRVLVIATYNELYFWDWSKPEPFVQIATGNPKEKIRYVAFDKLGHKLITGIANSPQTRWERARAQQLRPVERLGHYRIRMTPRPLPLSSYDSVLTTTTSTTTTTATTTTFPQQYVHRLQNVQETNPDTTRVTVSSFPERERRITASYRNLLREYEQLVQRYLKIYRPPTMIDRGTDPMETNPNSTTSGTQTPTEISNDSPSTSSNDPQPSTSQQYSSGLMMPSRLIAMRRQSTLVNSTQTATDTRKHKSSDCLQEPSNEKRAKCEEPSNNAGGTAAGGGSGGGGGGDDDGYSSSTSTSTLTETGTQTQSPRRMLVINSPNSSQTEASPSCTNTNQDSNNNNNNNNNNNINPGVRILCPKTTKRKLFTNNNSNNTTTTNNNNNNNNNNNKSTSDNNSYNEPQPSTSTGRTSDYLLLNVRPIAEEVRNRFLPIIKSLPACDRPKLIRRFENGRAYERMKLERRGMVSNFLKKTNRRPILDTSSDSSSSDDDTTTPTTNSQQEPTIEENSTEINKNNSNNNDNNNNTNMEPEPSTSSNQQSTAARTNINDVRNFVMKLEQLLMTVLLTEVDVNDTQNDNNQELNETGTSLTNQDYSYRRDPSPIDLSSRTTRFNAIIRPTFVNDPVSFLRNRNRTTTTTTTATTTTTTTTVASSDTFTNTTTTANSRSSMYLRYPRRRLMSTHHRISAFTPTRVNYNRNPIRYRRWSSYRSGPRHSGLTHPVNELLNFSTRTNNNNNNNTSEDDPLLSSSSSANDAGSSLNNNNDGDDNINNNSTDNVNLGDFYNHILQDLESSLNDVRNIRENTRAGERSDMLNSFSESLENIMTQSDTILRNLGGSMMMLPNYNNQRNNNNNNNNNDNINNGNNNEPRMSFYDQNFYIRDNSNSNINDNSNGRSVIESDHNYPRIRVNPNIINDNNNNNNNGSSSNNSNNSAPFMTSLHMTISYIQQQARLLRQQVDSIERIDRAMLEVEQLQLIRQLIMEILRYIRALGANSIINGGGIGGNIENRTNTSGMSSVRQMMAGTRISDSSPYDDSQSEEQTSTVATTQTTTTTTTTQTNLPSTSRTTESTTQRHQLHESRRGCGRKTYPPSRLFRFHRHYRRSLVNYFPRRYAGRSDRGSGRHANPSRSQAGLNLMVRRLEHLLTQQARLWTQPQDITNSQQQQNRPASTEVGERLLSLRLHDCVLRMDRLLQNHLELTSRFHNYLSESPIVTPDGAPRYTARHFLSLIVDGMSRHIEELGGGNNLPLSLRTQIHSVLTMALLLCDLLSLQLVDTIPPPIGMNLDLGRDQLTTRIDQMCGQMLQNRFSSHSQQLTRSLQDMRDTMRFAYRTLGQTYTQRRNAMLPNRQEPNQRLILNRYLRSFFRRRPRNTTDTATNNTNNQSEENSDRNRTPPHYSTEYTRRICMNLRNLIMRYTDNGELSPGSSPLQDDTRTGDTGGGSGGGGGDNDNPLSIITTSSNNSDDDTEPEIMSDNNTNNINNPTRNSEFLHNLENNQSTLQQSSITQSPRMWNVPSVHVNDVPVSEPLTLFHPHVMTRRLAQQRASELNLPQMSVLRPRFLHPFYSGATNPLDVDLDEQQREVSYDCDMSTTVTPNHRIQVWDISSDNIPAINNPLKNIIVSECKIHNDASVDIAKDGTILVTLLPSGGYLNVTNRLGVYSLKWNTLGQCLYTTSFEQNAVSVALSPLSRHLVVGLASRRVSIVPSDRWTMARIFMIDQKDAPGDRLPVLRDLGQDRDSRATSHKSVNCIRWLPTSGQGLIYATNTGQLVILT